MKNTIHKAKRFLLTVAGFYIAVDLNKITDSDIVTSLSHYLTALSKNIVPLSSKNNVDFAIYYVAEEKLRFVTGDDKNNKQYFLRTFVLGKENCYVDYHVSISQFKFLLKLIIQNLLSISEGFLLHASAVLDTNNNWIYLFLGPNGAGKSTIVKNLRSVYTAYADDMIPVRIINKKWYAYQFLLEKNNIPFLKNDYYPIKGVFILKKGNHTQMINITFDQLFQKFVTQIVDSELKKDNMQLVLQFLASVKQYSILEVQKSANGMVLKKLFEKKSF